MSAMLSQIGDGVLPNAIPRRLSWEQSFTAFCKSINFQDNDSQRGPQVQTSSISSKNRLFLQSPS